MTRVGIGLGICLLLLAAMPLVSAATVARELFLHPLPDGRVHLLPERIDVDVGDTLQLDVHNSANATDGSARDLVLCRAAATAADKCQDVIARTAAIPPSVGERLVVELDRAGTFSYFCELGCPRVFRNPETGIGAGTLVVAGTEEPKNGAPLGVLVAIAGLALVAGLRRRAA